MPYSSQEKNEKYKEMFGLDVEGMDEFYKQSDLMGVEMLAMSVISDAQFVISPESVTPDLETARQYMNKAKWLLSKLHSKARGLEE